MGSFCESLAQHKKGQESRGKDVSLGGFDADLTVLWERVYTAQNLVAEALVR